MISPAARKRFLEKPPENATRAQKMNQVEDRILSRKMSGFQREQKHLMREIDNLRKSRHVLSQRIEPLCLPRSRSATHPSGMRSVCVDAGQLLNCNDDSKEKLPQLPQMKTQLLSPRQRSSSTLSVPESGTLLSSKSLEGLNKCEEWDQWTSSKSLTPEPRRRASLLKLADSRMRSAERNAGKDESQQNVGRKIGIGGRPLLRQRAFSDSSHLDRCNSYNVIPAIVCEGVEETVSEECTPSLCGLNGQGGHTPPILSPVLRRGSTGTMAFAPPVQKTNRELMEDKQLISKFKSVGHLSLGAAIVRHMASPSFVGELADENDYSPEVNDYSRAKPRRKSIKKLSRSKTIPNSKETRKCSRVTEISCETENQSNSDGDDVNNSSNNNNNKIGI